MTAKNEPMRTIAALFVRSDSIYKTYPAIDCHAACSNLTTAYRLHSTACCAMLFLHSFIGLCPVL